MKRSFFLSAIFLLMFSSCSKEDSGNSAPETSPAPNPGGYYPMSEGSYWIYDMYQVDANGVASPFHQQDSLFVMGVFEENGHYYFQMSSKRSVIPFEAVRDSSGYLLDFNGAKVFAPNDFSYPLNTFYRTKSNGDTLYYLEDGMKDIPDQINVPAGSFNTLMMEQDAVFFDFEENRMTKHTEEYRADEVGIVLFRQGNFINSSMVELRLLRYHIEE